MIEQSAARLADVIARGQATGTGRLEDDDGAARRGSRRHGVGQSVDSFSPSGGRQASHVNPAAVWRWCDWWAW